MPRTAALLGILMFLGPLACASTVHPGLANAPALGSNPPVDATVHDVVANGRDSCERKLGPGPLRDEVPPCPGVERPASPPIVVASPALSGKGIVMPWVEHYYSRGPCVSSEDEADRMTLARQPPYTASSRSLGGLTCWPL
jgi:hypothetical protein